MSVTGISWVLWVALTVCSVALILVPRLFGYSSREHRRWGFWGLAIAAGLLIILFFFSACN